MCKMQEALAQGIVGVWGGDCKAFGNGREGGDKNLMQKYLALKYLHMLVKARVFLSIKIA